MGEKFEGEEAIAKLSKSQQLIAKEHSIYRSIRSSASVKFPADLPAVLLFCNEVASYFNESYRMKMVTVAKLFGHSRVYWFYDVTNLSEVAQLNTELVQDRLCIDMIQKVKLLWLWGSMKGNIVKFRRRKRQVF